MPYSIVKVNGGYQVTSPNHPEGHSKKPMSLKNAQAQKRIMEESESGQKKAASYRAQKGAGPE